MSLTSIHHHAPFYSLSARISKAGRTDAFFLLNLFGIAASVLTGGYCLLAGAQHAATPWAALHFAPVLLFAVVLLLRRLNRIRPALIITFYGLPVLLLIVGAVCRDYNVAYFILFAGAASCFFIKSVAANLSAFLVAAVCFLVLRYHEILHGEGFVFSTAEALLMAIQACMVALGYATLAVVRAEIARYHEKLVNKNRRLHNLNREMIAQKNRLAGQAQEMQQQQETLVASDALKTRLLSVISHDLRLPLISVKNIFDVYEKKMLDTDAFLKFVPQLNNEICQSLELLENLLQWSKQQMGVSSVCPEKLSLAAITNPVVELYTLASAGKGITVNNCIDPEIEVEADRQMVKMVLRNLISNAIKFTPDGGLIHLTAEADGEVVWVRVTDNGAGMSPAQIQCVLNGSDFSTAGTRQESGSGLGLKLCRGFVEKNGGSIEIHSKPGYGCTVAFSLQLFIHKPKEVLAAVPEGRVVPMRQQQLVNQAKQRVGAIAGSISNVNRAGGNR